MKQCLSGRTRNVGWFQSLTAPWEEYSMSKKQNCILAYLGTPQDETPWTKKKSLNTSNTRPSGHHFIPGVLAKSKGKLVARQRHGIHLAVTCLHRRSRTRRLCLKMWYTSQAVLLSGKRVKNHDKWWILPYEYLLIQQTYIAFHWLLKWTVVHEPFWSHHQWFSASFRLESRQNMWQKPRINLSISCGRTKNGQPQPIVDLDLLGCIWGTPQGPS